MSTYMIWGLGALPSLGSEELSRVQKALEWSKSYDLKQIEVFVREERESVLYHEELLSKQKAQCDWLLFIPPLLSDIGTRSGYRDQGGRFPIYSLQMIYLSLPKVDEGVPMSIFKGNCSFLWAAPEDGLHAIRDYRVAKENQDLAFRGVDWSVFFGLVSWRVWKNMNFYIFQGSPWSEEEMINGALRWAKQYGLSPKVIPKAGLVVVKVELGVVVVEGVLKDDREDWIMGFNRRLGRGTIFKAELWGILDGLSLLQGRHRGRVLLQTDSMEVIEEIKESISKTSNSALIRRIYQSVKTVDLWLIQHIPREENREGDQMAKLAFDRKEELKLFTSCPSGLA
ncbi:hypothetical protein Gogos_020436 [Gossypium gossypioides]|uniref:RNase H type-1 domain-containing protein n=1 Tax=Gossypium gossypioides TaxID=34282 RepID=A0A7J9CYG8_GOSGO|nr:hypothetical protein [Gossypium gossypioides]